MEGGEATRILSEDEARAILERAARIDERCGMTIADLRAVASEAGISEEAVSVALRQVIGQPTPVRLRPAVAPRNVAPEGVTVADAFGLWACFMAGWSIVFGQVGPDLVFSVGSIGILAAFIGIVVLRAGRRAPDPAAD
jgi:hypothetical protein